MGRLTDEQLRRQGRADAVIMLVLKRINGATMTAEDWAQLLDLDQADIVAALDRMRIDRGLPPKTTKPEGSYLCGIDGCPLTFATPKARGTHRRTHTLVECSGCGRTFTEPGLGPHRRHCKGTSA